MANKLVIPDTVNPVSPPNGPTKAPPNVATSINNIALIIVPKDPATAAFHSPPRAPEWAR